MQTTVFVSHSTKDTPIARSICEQLESRGLCCWIDARDIRPGQRWADEVVSAIETSGAFALLLSSNSNGSKHVREEVEHASRLGRPIYPIRIEDVAPAGPLALFVGSRHYCDVYRPPIDDAMEALVGALSDRDASTRQLSLGYRPTQNGYSKSEGRKGSGIVTGSRVNLREGPTVSARRVASLNRGDSVRVIRKLVLEGTNECQLRDDFEALLDDGTVLTFLAGRAFSIAGGRLDEYKIELDRPTGARHFYIPRDRANLLDPALWYEVECAHGSGWVFGRYVRPF